MYLVHRDKYLNCKTADFEKSLTILEKVFPKGKSWRESKKLFGDMESTGIQVSCYEDNDTDSAEYYYPEAYDLGEYKGDEIYLRIDRTRITKEEIKIICKFAKVNNLLVHYKCNIYEPSFENFKEIIINSEANKFVSDPKKFFDELSTEK